MLCAVSEDTNKPLATCTVAQWLKTVMGQSGTDISKYKAHSIRAAKTSKAKSQGMSTEQILERANWSKASTFYRFYHRQIDQRSQFQAVVLKTNESVL